MFVEQSQRVSVHLRVWTGDLSTGIFWPGFTYGGYYYSCNLGYSHHMSLSVFLDTQNSMEHATKNASYEASGLIGLKLEVSTRGLLLKVSGGGGVSGCDAE